MKMVVSHGNDFFAVSDCIKIGIYLTREACMFGLEIRKPSRETVIGFIITWICVIGIIFFTLALVRIGA